MALPYLFSFMAVVHLTDQNFAAEVLKSEIPVLVDFFAVWCGPCKAMSPVIDELAAAYDGKIKICKLDVDQNPETSQKYGVMSIPALLFFKGGETVDSLVGLQSKEKLEEKLTALVG